MLVTLPSEYSSRGVGGFSIAIYVMALPLESAVRRPSPKELDASLLLSPNL